MKAKHLMPLIAVVLLWGCKEKEVATVEKLVFTETDIKKCECEDKKAICYYDTVKTLMVLNDVTGVLRKDYYDTTKIVGILIENADSYITGSKEFRQPFHFWWVMSGNVIPCNMPTEITFSKKYAGRKVKLSCKVDEFPLPLPGHGYPQADGYSIVLQKIEILK